jgi:hypothetical protein
MLRRPLACALVSGVAALGVPAPASGSSAALRLTTHAYIDYARGNVVVVTATGSFSGGFVANNAVALQVTGAHQWIDGSGQTRVTPLAAAPSAIRFANTNTVVFEFQLVSFYDTFNLQWTAEAAGLAPTPFAGTCAGTWTRIDTTGGPIRSC